MQLRSLLEQTAHAAEHGDLVPMPRISVDLTDEQYDRLHKLKVRYLVHTDGFIGIATHAEIMRAALRLLFDVADAASAGEVVCIASGARQRVKQVLAQPESGGGVRISRRGAGKAGAT